MINIILTIYITIFILCFISLLIDNYIVGCDTKVGDCLIFVLLSIVPMFNVGILSYNIYSLIDKSKILSRILNITIIPARKNR